MAVLLVPEKWQEIVARVVVFDLEFVGNIAKPKSCLLWEIGAVHLATGRTFSVIINQDVANLPPPLPGCFDVTPEFLATNGVSLPKALQQLIRFVGNNTVLMSHNCFKSDKLVLEGAFDSCQIQYPPWLFIDSLFLLRQQIKLSNYKLSTVYDHLFHQPIEQMHRALPDACALQKVLIAIGPLSRTICLYPFRLTPLQLIRGIGHACELCFICRGIRSVEEILVIIQTEHACRLICQPTTLEQSVDYFLQQCHLPVASYNLIAQELIWRITNA